ncbi:MAG: DUF5378 domain-containing protein [Mycoplasmoidaceae bacterium]|nr:DUF5378 domain-containing protein [Mycoplasmoidaceae bacterium]
MHDEIYKNLNTPDLGYQRDLHERISRAFMLDACPCFFALLMISLIADPSRRMARIFAPIALIGGITALGTIITQNNIWEENAVFSAKYFFLGLGKERCFFIMH